MTNRVVRTFYRAVDTEGHTIIESRDPREVTRRASGLVVTYQRAHTYEIDGPWEPWTPTGEK